MCISLGYSRYLFNSITKRNIMPERPFGNDNAGEQLNNELDENSPANNNEQSDGEDDENQSQGDEEEVCFLLINK